MVQKDNSQNSAMATDITVGGLKNKTPKQIFRFFVTSMITGAIGLGTFWALSQIDYFDQYRGGKEIWLMVAEVISVLFSCVCNYLLNKRFTFKQRGKKNGMLLYVAYYAVTTPLGGWLIVALVGTGFHPVLAKLIKMCINAVLDFLYCKYIIFPSRRKRGDKQEQAADTDPTTQSKKNLSDSSD